jgi:hypothetical protein
MEDELRCVFFCPKQARRQDVELVNKIYLFWHEVWTKTYAELDQKDRLFSDDFARHDEIVAIFQGNFVVGLFCFNWFWPFSVLDMDSRYWENYPTWLSSWAEEKRHSLLMSMSYLTVHPLWRKSQGSIPISELLVGLAVKRFASSKADALLTYTRNDRKTNELGYRHGGAALETMRTVHNIPSDAIAFDRMSIQESSTLGVGTRVEALWNKAVFATECGRPSAFSDSPTPIRASHPTKEEIIHDLS